MTDLLTFSLEDLSNKLSENNQNKPVKSVIQLFRPGEFNHPTYGKLVFDMQMFKAIKQNFDNNVRRQRIAVDFDHNGEKHAAGWIEQLEITPDGVFALVEWTPLGVQAIKNKEYLYISPDYKPIWKDPETGQTYEYVLFGAALTNRPFIKGMQEVHLSEDSINKMIDDFFMDFYVEDPSKAKELSNAFKEYIGGEQIMDKDTLTHKFNEFINNYTTQEGGSSDMNENYENKNQNNENVELNEPGFYYDEENDITYLLDENGIEWDVIGEIPEDNITLMASSVVPNVLLAVDNETGDMVALSETETPAGEPEIVLHEFTDGDPDLSASIVLSEGGTTYVAFDDPYDEKPPVILLHDGEDYYDVTEDLALTYTLAEEEGIDPMSIQLSEALETSIQLQEELSDNMVEEYDEEPYYEEAPVQLAEPNVKNEQLILLEEEIAELRKEIEEQKKEKAMIEESYRLAEIEQLVDTWITPDNNGYVKMTPAERDHAIKLMSKMSNRELTEFINMVENRPAIRLSEVGTGYQPYGDEGYVLSERFDAVVEDLKKKGLSHNEALLKAAEIMENN